MKCKFVNRPLVKFDLQKAKDYYKNISPKLATDFINRIREAKKFIALNPEGDDVMYNKIRMQNIYQFPYHIHYYVDNENKRIVILAIEFSKRDDLDFTHRK